MAILDPVIWTRLNRSTTLSASIAATTSQAFLRPSLRLATISASSSK